VRRTFASSTLALALSLLAAPALAWSLSKDIVRPALRAAAGDSRDCAIRHTLAEGRYVMWITVGASGHARAEVRDAPAPLEPAARRCLARAFEQQRYPTPVGATVAWSASSPPGSSYSIAYPFILAVHAYGYDGGAEPRLRIRPKPARARWLSRAAGARARAR
jgi:hypothetical protein